MSERVSRRERESELSQLSVAHWGLAGAVSS